jgi:hypothetical protein
MQQQLGLQLGAPAATGPEIAEAVKAVFRAAGAPIVWEEQHIGKTVDERTNSFVTGPLNYSCAAYLQLCC